MKIGKFIFGLILSLLIIVFPFSQWQPSPLDSIETLAVQLDGRKKPLDTVARETVAQIHGRSSYKTATGEKLDSLSTYLSMWFNDRDWNQEPFILFNYRPLKEKLELDIEQKYFSFGELVSSPLSQYLSAVKQKQAQGLDLNREEREAISIETRLGLMIGTVGQNDLPLVPHPTDIKGKWLGVEQAGDYYGNEQVTPIVNQLQTLKAGYQNHLATDSELAMMGNDLQTSLRNLSPNIYPSYATLAEEVKFSVLHPFAKAWIIYALAFMVMVVTLISEKLPLYWTATGIFTGGILIQSYGFIARMSIANRPPVTNMYESVIWVAFAIAVAAIVFEFIYQAKYYLLAAAPLAVACLILADSLPAVLDGSIQPLVPVLRDNFWLSIHVPTITASYACFALVMGLGHVILGHYLVSPAMNTRITYLSKLNYRVIQVGVFLLATGIILGGIWAHFSWGRFWGWDPKETWALITWLVFATYLHARITKGWEGKKTAVLGGLGFFVIWICYLGVNFLGKGLHSYGWLS